jgi:hypothetical protein
MEERDYYLGRVTGATDEQRAWVEERPATGDTEAIAGRPVGANRAEGVGAGDDPVKQAGVDR